MQVQNSIQYFIFERFSSLKVFLQSLRTTQKNNNNRNWSVNLHIGDLGPSGLLGGFTSKYEWTVRTSLLHGILLQSPWWNHWEAHHGKTLLFNVCPLVGVPDKDLMSLKSLRSSYPPLTLRVHIISPAKAWNYLIVYLAIEWSYIP